MCMYRLHPHTEKYYTTGTRMEITYITYNILVFWWTMLIQFFRSKTWKTTKQIEVECGFKGRCLRRIINNRWPNVISNSELSERTGVLNIVNEIMRRQWAYIGHILWMDNNRLVAKVLTWTQVLRIIDCCVDHWVKSLTIKFNP